MGQRLNQSPEALWSDVSGVLGHIRVTQEDVFKCEQNDEFASRISIDEDLCTRSKSIERRYGKCRTINSSHHHYIFISHHKAGGGTEATLMQEALERMIDQDPEIPGHGMVAPVFLDSEDLSDLTDLKAHVRNASNLVLLLTEEVLKRPWVLVEIVTAYQTGVNIVPVEIYKREDKSFKYPGEEFYKKLREGGLLTEAEINMIGAEGITVEDLEKALRHVFKKIAVPFSPHKSQLVREAELTDILRRCTGTNHQSDPNIGTLLTDLPNVPGNMLSIVPSGSSGPFQDLTRDTVIGRANGSAASSSDGSGVPRNSWHSLNSLHRRSPLSLNMLLSS